MTSVSGKRMAGYLPGYYSTSRVMSTVLDAQGTEVDKLRQALSETLDQLYVGTATWGLDSWERELGIGGLNASKPLEQRRSVILSRLRGVGVVTKSLIKSVSEAYDGGRVDVNVQPTTYSFTIKFMDTRGIPPNLNDLKNAIEEIKPAHMEVEYKFSYLTFDALTLAGKTFSQVDELAMTFAQFEAWQS